MSMSMVFIFLLLYCRPYLTLPYLTSSSFHAPKALVHFPNLFGDRIKIDVHNSWIPPPLPLARLELKKFRNNFSFESKVHCIDPSMFANAGLNPLLFLSFFPCSSSSSQASPSRLGTSYRCMRHGVFSSHSCLPLPLALPLPLPSSLRFFPSPSPPSPHCNSTTFSFIAHYTSLQFAVFYHKWIGQIALHF